MPRIDPSQLLRTLSQLLSVEGGIRSAEEVPRIVKLMQKFSKKLVSKCIYIHILRASEMELLELFLQQKGWDLLNLWFMDSINCLNWYLCGDLVKLFAICPMNPARLKENVEVNQAPKLIRQLSIDSRLDADIRNQAQQVLQQWMSVIRAPPPSQPIQATVSTSQPSPPSPPASGDDCGDKSADWKPESAVKKKKPEKKITLTKNNKSQSPDDSVDVDDLLGGDSSSEDEDDPIKKKKAEIERRRQEREDRKAKDEERERKKAQERKEKSKLGYSKSELGNRGSVDSQEKERIREVARKMKEESEQKQKSKNPESKPPEAEQKGNRMTDGLGRIPRLPKKEPSQEVKKGKEVPSFGDLLGGMDTPKPPKAIIKNKNKDLMDSLMNNSPTKPSVKKEERKKSLVTESRSREKEDSRSRDKEDIRSRDKEDSRSRDKEERHKAKEERRASLSGKEGTPDKSSKDKSGDGKSPSSKSGEKNGHKESSSVRPKPSLVMPEKEEKKMSVKEASPEVKKAQSPKVIKESNFFGDVLGDVMKEQPRKRKRRLSEVRAEREAKEEAERQEKRRKEEEEEEEATRKEKSPSEPEEKMEIEENGDLELFPEEPSCELPREVRGILVLARGARKSRKLQWKSESELIEIRYFEMDETERANVWKQKTFEEMRKAESLREKQLGHPPVEEQEEKEWKAVPISFRDSETKNQVEKIWECYGKGSTEKGVQDTREGRVLKSLFFNALPSDPTEPDQADRGGDSRSTVDIPGVDQSDADTAGESTVDHSNNGWPTPKDLGGPPAPAPNLSSLSALLQDLKPGILQGILNPHLNAPPPSLNSADAELFQAQAAAAAALAQQQQQDFHSQQQQQQGPGEYPQHHQEHGPDRYPLDRPPPGYQRGHHNDRGHHHNNFHRDRSHSSPRFPPGREDFHGGGFRGGPGFRGREGRREDRRDGREFKRPCKFWMDRGSCKQEDKCLYPHPGR